MEQLKKSQDVFFLQSRNHHLALTQYFRWFQVYERPFTEKSIHNQLDILSDDIVIESVIETARGKEEYQERLKVYAGSLNAHHVKNIEVTQIDQNTLQLKANVQYQGIFQNDHKTNAHVNYHALLSLSGNQIPQFTHIKITLEEQKSTPSFTDAYPYNRAASLMHYWLYNIESPQPKSSTFKGLLADDFELELSGSLKITNWDQLTHWIDNIEKRIKYSAHATKNLSAIENSDGTITMNVEFDWNGITIDNKPMIAATQHTWILENDHNERFARIKKMFVKELIPFQIVNEDIEGVESLSSIT